MPYGSLAKVAGKCKKTNWGGNAPGTLGMGINNSAKIKECPTNN